jgi:Gene product 88
VQTKPRTLKQAQAIAGTLGKPSKMPGYSYGISAHHCKTGATLATVSGSVCEGCYALKANYQYPSVRAAHEKRLAGLYHPYWVDAMVLMIQRTNTQYFRWHDSGDIQSLQHLSNIVRVAESLPDVMFWIPTREKALVRQWNRAFGAFPSNLIVRVSGAMVDGPAPSGFANVSVVVSISEPIGHRCPAPQQGNNCGDCRACWTPAVHCVTYHQH